ncbi:hypothetical protein O7627_01520 [Solwaraspora sp. WMMD1047]|uniref:hypothetical protein n=1 Tax=Solwaraspora sp. WMMD1047 TaxID=3016102 RepID=UPI002416A956|nr:hypothetical protein [Solwaraspora sp. WMMD1047]MDG4827980.1 hypothetical protein [Solwaraspora sp. WMMD1047]
MCTRLAAAGRIGAVLLLLGPTLAADPAYATGQADLAVEIDGATLRGTDPDKAVVVTVVNRGTVTARSVRLRVTGWVDSEVMNPATLRFCAADDAETVPSPRPTAVPSLQVSIDRTCAVADLPAGASTALRATPRTAANATGTVGKLTLTVSHAGTDARPADNAASSSLTLAGPAEQDLYVRAWSVPAEVAQPPETGAGATQVAAAFAAVGAVEAARAAAVPPGGVGELRFEVGNRGAGLSGGMTVVVRLPDQVRFAETHPGCAYGTDHRSATCTYLDLPLVPSVDDADPGDRVYSALRFSHLLRVADSAPAPATLDGGLLRVTPVAAGYVPGLEAVALPGNSTGLRARDYGTAGEAARFEVLVGAAAGTAPEGLPLTGRSPGWPAVLGLLLTTLGLLLAHLSRRTPHPA